MAVGLFVIADDQIIICNDKPANSEQKDTDGSVEDCALPHGLRALIARKTHVIGELHLFL